MSQPILSWGADFTSSAFPRLQAVRFPAVWLYDTGTPDIEETQAQIEHFRQAGSRVYLINQGFGPRAADPFWGDEDDVEAGAWTVSQFVDRAAARRERQWSHRGYMSWDKYGQAVQLLAERGIDRSVFFRIADWSLSSHLAQLMVRGDLGNIYAGQWASPSSNPLTVIPGTSITLTAANCDLSAWLAEPTGWQG